MTKYGRPDLGRPSIEDLGDVGMIHQCQRLPFGLEPGDDTFRVHARFDDLQATRRRTGSCCSAMKTSRNRLRRFAP